MEQKRRLWRKQHTDSAELDTLTIFSLTSGRSGTLSLCKLLKNNAPHCTINHETNRSLQNPSMFGPAIYHHATGDAAAVRGMLQKKRRAIDRCRTPVYVETSHAFLKSYWDLAPEMFPKIKVFHLIRQPMEVARSEANREEWMRFTYRRYRGPDGVRYKHWALTGLEPIYRSFDVSELTLFQQYLIQWIEIENRAMEFLRRFDMAGRCLTLHSPQALNDPATAAAILDFAGAGRSGDVSLPGVQNRTPGHKTVLGVEEASQLRDVIAALPSSYLEIFEHDPYADQPWASLLSK
ncbi:hypothetical protein BH11ACT7_BH11ACT7_30200 [soil metagenome]